MLDLSPFPAIDHAESELLTALGASEYEKRAVKLRSGFILNTVSAGRENAPKLVLCHGWGSGVAFYGRNLTGLAQHFRVFLVDWLGFGASSRPHFATDMAADVAENFFVNAFEEWVDAMKDVEPGWSNARFHLVGHSLGGFLSVGFAIRKSELVESLVLASPVGVPRKPSVRPPSGGIVSRLVRQVLLKLWEWRVTPQLLIRHLGPWLGRILSRRLLLARFKAEDAKTKDALVEYFYQLSTAPASGEHSLSTILRPGAWASHPLVDKLPFVQCPVQFLYGDRDWMDSNAALDVIPRMKKATLHFVKNAGHHVYYDNPEEFNRIVVDACLKSIDNVQS